MLASCDEKNRNIFVCAYVSKSCGKVVAKLCTQRRILDRIRESYLGIHSENVHNVSVSKSWYTRRDEFLTKVQYVGSNEDLDWKIDFKYLNFILYEKN